MSCDLSVAVGEKKEKDVKEIKEKKTVMTKGFPSCFVCDILHV